LERPKYTYAYGKCQAPSYDQSSHRQQMAKCHPQTLTGLLLVRRHHVPPAISDGTATLAGQAGRKPQSPLQAIREKCRDCSNEIRACEAVKCALADDPDELHRRILAARLHYNIPLSEFDG
jgi:hypothetical protein